jgi:hypothetical protein
LHIKSKSRRGVTWLPKIRYNIEVCFLFISSAGAQPKNDANDMPRYGDIKVRSAVRTTLGYLINL